MIHGYQINREESMPTYAVNHSNFNLSADQKEEIARCITRTHNSVTGAQSYFVQVIFNGLPQGNHFIGGKLAAEPQLFLHGQIRAGRSPEVKEQLILDLRDSLAGVSGLDKSHIWIYLLDLIPSQMIEYGEILPESGRESEWFAGLSPHLKEKLASLGK